MIHLRNYFYDYKHIIVNSNESRYPSKTTPFVRCTNALQNCCQLRHQWLDGNQQKILPLQTNQKVSSQAQPLQTRHPQQPEEKKVGTLKVLAE